MSTTDYSPLTEQGFAGQVATLGNVERITLTAGGDIAFGKAVARVTTDPEKITVLNATDSILAGVAVMKNTNVSGTPYKENDPVIVLRKGAIWMKAKVAVIKGEKAYIDHATGDATNSATDSTDTKGEFLSSAAAGEMAIVDINIPNR